MKITKYLSIAALSALVFTACMKDYNDHFEGLEQKTEITNVQKGLEYTLTTKDYQSIADNEDNKLLAGENIEVLEAVGTNGYFATAEDAQAYIPAFLASGTTYTHLSVGSTMLVTANVATSVPEELTALQAVKSYTLSSDDYAALNGDEANAYVSSQTESKIAEVLSAAGYEEGDYVAVAYKYFDGGSSDAAPEPAPEFAYSDVIGSLTTGSGAVTIKGYVAAVGTQGFIVLDKSGALYIYRPETYPAVGSNVTVSGTVGNYGNGLQLVAGATVTEEASDLVLYNDAPISIDAATIDELTGRTEVTGAIYATMTGKLSISGSYYNLTIDGVSEKQGSLVYPSEAIQAQIADGQTITVNGYFVYSSSGNKYANMVVVSVGEESLAYVPVQFPYGNGKYLIVAEQDGAHIAAGAATQQGSAAPYYGYPSGVEVAAVGGVIAADVDAATVWSIEPASEDTFYIKNDSDSYYYYLTTYASFSLAEEPDAANESYKYSFGKDDEGVYKIMNVGAGKWWQYTTYKTYGAYNSQQNGSANPQLYRLASVSAAAVSSYAANAAVTRANTVEDKYAVYKFDGTKFTAAADVAVVQPADYTAMGQNNGFADGAEENLLPKYLKVEYPYANAGDIKYAAYRVAGNWAAAEYKFDGAEWTKCIYYEATPLQFRKNSGESWAYYPVLTLDYSKDGTDEVKAFTQYCINWVYDNIEVPLGAPARDNAGEIINTAPVTVNGENLVDTDEYTYCFTYNKGNGEYYAGAYSNYGELNWRPSYIPEGGYQRAAQLILDKGLEDQISLGIDEMSLEEIAEADELDDEVVVAAMQKNCQLVFKNVLHYMYPNMTADNYGSVIINIYQYWGTGQVAQSRSVYSWTFEVVGTGEFEYVEGSFGLAQ